MKKALRILTLMLAVLMLVTCFAACNKNKGGNHKTPAPTDDNGPSNNNNNNNNPSKPNNDNEQTTTPPAEDEVIMPEAVDLDGYTYRAYVRSNAATGTPVEDGNP
jgi:hypothetical protein